MVDQLTMNSNPTIENLRKEFAAILTLYNDIIAKKTETDAKINAIKDAYNDLVKKNPVKTLLFCLDSLFFQYKILNLELEHYNRKIALLQNRMYGDYYKLYHLMVSQIKDVGIVLGGEAAQHTQDLPIYKDIDPFYKYKLEDITTIHSRILDGLGELYKACDTKTANIKQHRDGFAVGDSLLIFINAMEYERDNLLGHIRLFSKYLEFYHQSQARYFDAVYRSILDFCANLEDSVLVRIENFQGEALAEPYTATLPDTSDVSFNLEDIYSGGMRNVNKKIENHPKPPIDKIDSAFDLEEKDDDTIGPYLNLQPLGSHSPDENNTSSTGTIVYIEAGDTGEQAEPINKDYIPQNDNIEECNIGEDCDENNNIETDNTENNSAAIDNTMNDNTEINNMDMGTDTEMDTEMETKMDTEMDTEIETAVDSAHQENITMEIYDAASESPPLPN